MKHPLSEVYQTKKKLFLGAYDRYVKDDYLLDYLTNKSDYFTAPASSHFHLAFSGGLFLHSWNVFKTLRQFVKSFQERLGISPDPKTLFIIGMFHDLCKTNFYKHGFKWYKGADTNNKWVQRPVWEIDDKLPLGHSEKSLFLLERYIDLSDEEACAIRFHMGHTDKAVHEWALGQAMNNAWDKFPLAKILYFADYVASVNEKELSFYVDDEWIDVPENLRFEI